VEALAARTGLRVPVLGLPRPGLLREPEVRGMNPDYAIFVFPTPWRWLSVLNLVIFVSLFAWQIWRQRQARRRIMQIAEPMIDACRRLGLDDQAEELQRSVDRLQRRRRAKQAPVEVST
jgi:hypothetical protein